MSKFTFLRITGPHDHDWKFESVDFNTNPQSDEASKEQLPFFQKAVGGYIEYVPLLPGIFAIINEEGKLQDLAPTAAWLSDGYVHDVLVGNICVVRGDDGGFTLPLLESDLPAVKRVLRPLVRK